MKIVVKLGSSLVSSKNGINTNFLNSLIKSICTLSSDFVVVTSGAVASGMFKLSLTEKPKDTALLQALAAIGQSDLINAYEKGFAAENKIIAQLLLTNRDFSDHDRYMNIRNTLNTLISRGIVPIINENDPVTTMDVKKSAFGDNDTLSAHVAAAIDADLLIILTTVDGLYDRNPSEEGAKLITLVEQINECQAGYCKGVSPLGRGGMLSKVQAAKIATEAGIPVVVANGLKPNALSEAIAKKSGTLFKEVSNPSLNQKKHWLAFASEPKGTISVNPRSMQCAINKSCSILAEDVLSVYGFFQKGDVIDIADEDGTVVCRGITNFSSMEIEKIKGLSSSEISNKFGLLADIISSSNFVVAPSL